MALIVPFQWEMWIATVPAVFILITIFGISCKYLDETDEPGQLTLYFIGSIFEISSSSLIEIKNNAFRMFLGVFFLGFLNITYGYKAGLISSISVPYVKKPIGN